MEENEISNDKISKKKGSINDIFYYIGLLLFGTFLKLFLGNFEEQIAFYFFPVVSLISLVSFLIFFYKQLENVVTFCILLFFLSVAFPMMHFLIYKYDKNNYSFEKGYLSNKVRNYQEESNKHLDTAYLNDMMRLNSDSIFLAKINLISKDNIFLLNKYILKLELIEQPNAKMPGQMISVLGVYFSNGKKIGILDIHDVSNIYEAIEREKKLFTQLSLKSKKPDENILLQDFWIESITGFAFGQIKPITNLALAIRVFQIVFAYLFLCMMTNSLRASEKFVLKLKHKSV